MFFCVIPTTVNSNNAIPDSIVAKAVLLPAHERIDYYNNKIYDYSRNNPEAARMLIDSVFRLLKTHPDPDDEISALRGAGIYHLQCNRFDSAFYYVRQAEKLNTENNDLLKIAGIMIDYGNIYIAMGAADSALMYYHAADSMATISQNLILRGVALMNIGGIYQKHKADYEKALVYLEDSYNLGSLATPLNQISLFQKLGICYRHTGNDSLALQMAQQAYNLAMRENLMGDAAAAINSMGQIYKKHGDYEKATEAFEEARDIAIGLNIINGIIFTNGNLSQIYYETGRYQAGLELLRQILSISFEHNLTTIRINAYEEMIRFYKKLGDFEEALAVTESLNALHDSIAITETDNKIAELETRYQSKINKETIAQQNTQLKHDRMLIGSLAFVVCVVVLSLFIILKLFLQKNTSLKKLVSAHSDLTHKNAQIMKLLPCQPAHKKREDTNHIFTKIYTYLIADQHYLEQTLTLEAVATKTGINREYIRSSIKNEEKCSFKSFINNHRIDYAKKLIMEDFYGNQSIEEVAQKSGFSSRTSFYRTFKEITGFTPAYYKSHIQKQATGIN